MDYKKIKTDNFVATRDLNNFDQETGNIYQSLVILSKRANQIAADIKEELSEKIQDFASNSNLGGDSDEFYENKEQIEMARQYEQMPKPSLLAINEFSKKQIYYRLPEDRQEMIH